MGTELLISYKDVMEEVETRPLFRKIGKERHALDGAPDLHVFKFSNGLWGKYSFPDFQRAIRIGSSAPDADVYVCDNALLPIHLTVRQWGPKWYIFNSGPNDSCLFNGVARKQFVLGDNMACVINLQGNIFLFTTKNTEQLTKADKSDIEIVLGGKSFFLPDNRQVLIGGSELCDVRIPGEDDFVAIIFCFENRLYLLPMIEETMELEGRVKALPVPDEAELELNQGESLKVIYAPEKRKQAGFNKVIASLGRMELTEFDRTEKVFNKYMLPEEGRSVFLGRIPDNYFVLNSPDISRKHAQLMTYSDGVLVIDCGSVNGSFVNGEKIQRKKAVPGDVIGFGSRDFLLTYGE